MLLMMSENVAQKDVEQPRNNKLSYTVTSCWSFSYIIRGIWMHGTTNMKFRVGRPISFPNALLAL
jgi:hypothetical protein